MQKISVQEKLSDEHIRLMISPEHGMLLVVRRSSTFGERTHCGEKELSVCLEEREEHYAMMHERLFSNKVPAFVGSEKSTSSVSTRYHDFALLDVV